MNKKRKVHETADVPASFCLAAIRHKPDPQKILFEVTYDESWETREETRAFSEQLLKMYDNTFTAHGLELIVAIFHRSKNGTSAIFRSLGEWVSLASGKPPKKCPMYYEAIDTLQNKIHSVIGKDRIFTNLTPVVIKKVKAGIEVHLAPSLRDKEKRYIYYIPLALAKFLREKGGLKKVMASHLKIYYYVWQRYSSINGGTEIIRKEFQAPFINICNAAGVGHYLDPQYRQRPRAKKIIDNALAAMHKSGILENWEYLSKDMIKITPEPFHFKRAVKKDMPEIQVPLEEGRNNVSILKKREA